MGGTGGTGGGGEMVRPGLLFPGLFTGEVGGNLNALFIVPVRAREAAEARRPEGVVGESSSSSSSSGVSVFRLVVDVERTGTVGSAEFGADPSGTKGVGTPPGVLPGDEDGFRGSDLPPGLNGGGAAEDCRVGGVVVFAAGLVDVVGVDGGRGTCDWEAPRWEMDCTRLCPCTSGGIEAPR